MTVQNQGTMLHVAVGAASHGTPQGMEIVQLLLARGARIDARDARGDTPLHRTARCAGNTPGGQAAIAVMEILLARAADIEARNDKGQTPFAAFFGTTIEPDFLMPSSVRKPLLASTGIETQDTTDTSLVPVLEFFADHHADFNARNNAGQTPLGDTLSGVQIFFSSRKSLDWVPVRWGQEMAYLRRHGATEY
jgi:hypothetical protein